MNDAERIVITGMGLVSPLGTGVELAWSRVIASESGLSHLPEDIVEGIPSKVGGVVKGPDEDPSGGYAPGRLIADKDVAGSTACGRRPTTSRSRPT